MPINLDNKTELQNKTLKRVKLRYVLAMALIATFSIIAFTLNKTHHRKKSEDFKTINISGRQRMLTQKIALLTGKGDRQELLESKLEYIDGLKYLHASRFVQDKYGNVRKLYFGKDGINDLTKNFLPLIEHNEVNEDILNKIFILSQKLLQKYDQATLNIQNISEAERKDQLSSELIILLATLLLLILAIYLIFKPMTDEISSTFKKLNDIEDKALKSARLALIGETASSIGHDISNPLTVITGAAEGLMHFHADSLTPSGMDKIKLIIKHSAKINVILQGLKTQARLSNADPVIATDLNKLIKETLEMFDSKIKQHRIQVIIDDSSLVQVHCRRSAISQVVANLVSNAIDAVSEQELERKIFFKALKQDNYTILQIHDSGPGVPEELEDQIFESFVTTKEEGKGTGLGLSISKKIMEAHNGELRLNTSISRSCFEMVFLNIKQI